VEELKAQVGCILGVLQIPREGRGDILVGIKKALLFSKAGERCQD
jgi:hypothetical protein